jgi:hypothetical protein
VRKPVDPRTAWQQALEKGVASPGLIIATADCLALDGKWEHAAEFLKADLRRGIVVEPWVYKALAIALRQSGAPAEEVERAEVSGADLVPQDARGFLEAARALAAGGNYARALAFCRQAALLEPGWPQLYADAVGYAELAHDAQAMSWAAGRLLSQDWPGPNKALQARAGQKLASLVSWLDKEGRRGQAAALRQAEVGWRRRDLVIQLAWQGDAGLDLRVLEPTGSACTALQRQTVGGGALLSEGLAEPGWESYVAAEGYSGAYTVTVERIYGRPFADKAQLRIIRHRGTPQESEQLLTVELKSRQSEPVVVNLEGGRRAEAASVAPEALAEAAAEEPASRESPDAVLHKLRALSDPELAGYEAQGFKGGLSAPGRAVSPSAPARPAPEDAGLGERTLCATKVKSFVSNSLDVTAQAVLSADRRSVRVSLSPVFASGAQPSGKPAVRDPVIPGGP